MIGWASFLVSPVPYLLTSAALVGAIGPDVSMAVHAADTPHAVDVYALTSGRIVASTAAVVALIGAVAGGLATARAAAHLGTGHGRGGAIVALAAGATGLVVGGWVVATADGGLGTGNGLGGGVVAMALGLAGMALGSRALVRTRRST